MEAWKYTNLAALAELEFSAPGDGGPSSRRPISGLTPSKGWRDRLWSSSTGRLSPGHSRLEGLPEGLRGAGLARGLTDDPAGIEGFDWQR